MDSATNQETPPKKPKKIKRAVSIQELLNMRFKTMPFTGEWFNLMGEPEISGVWFIWANSGNGKTNFTLQLAKYLSQFGRVAYNTMEEGARRSFQRAVENTNMLEAARKLIILNREPITELKERLRKRKSPDIIIIDSFQYSGLTRAEYIKLKEEFSTKLFIFISHAEGKNPAGRTASFVRYDADVKIRIEGYRAFATSRYGGGEPYTIWHEGANEYWSNVG
jgi:hypothetical protein